MIQAPFHSKDSVSRLLSSGTQKTKLRARECVHWSETNAELIDMITNCTSCQEYHNRHPAEPPIVHEIPVNHGPKLGPTYFNYVVKIMLLLLTTCPNSLISLTFLTNLVQLSCYIPSAPSAYLVSSHKYSLIMDHATFPKNKSKFACERDFSHTTSGAEYAQSNGMVECTIQTIKNVLQKVI